METRKVAAITISLVGLGVLVACAAEATVSSYVQGTWECTSEGMDGPITLEIDDGTFTMSADGENITGTWDIAFGDLTINMDGMREFDLATAVGFPAADADPGAGYVGQWAPENSEGYVPEPGQVEVRTEDDAIRITHTSPEGYETTTTCSKG